MKMSVPYRTARFRSELDDTYSAPSWEDGITEQSCRELLRERQGEC